MRVTSAGLVAPRRVLYATWLAFGVAVVAGIYLATVAGWVIIVVGAASIAAGVLYTGGPRPYGYAGMGELFVFLFFGLVAVNGSYYVQLERLDWLPFWLSISIGLLSTAILVVNNVRDIDTDRRAGKRTLAVRLGRERTRHAVRGLRRRRLRRPLLGIARRRRPAAWRSSACSPRRSRSSRCGRCSTRTDGPALNGALAGTGALLGRLQRPGLRRAADRRLR